MLRGGLLHPGIDARRIDPDPALGEQLGRVGVAVIREPRAFRAAQVDSLGTFTAIQQTLVVTPRRALPPNQHYQLPWTHRAIRHATPP